MKSNADLAARCTPADFESLIRAIRDMCWESDGGPDRHLEHRPGLAATGEPYCAVCDAYRLLDSIEDRTP